MVQFIIALVMAFGMNAPSNTDNISDKELRFKAKDYPVAGTADTGGKTQDEKGGG